MKKNICLILLLGCVLAVSAREKPNSNFSYTGFSGGMMLHTGYVWSNFFPVVDKTGRLGMKRNEGFPLGIGGMLRFHFGKHFRVGGEGYSTNLSLPNKSFCRTGWGGLLIDFVWQTPKVAPFLGVTVGGGSQKLLLLPQDFQNGKFGNNVLFDQYSFMLLTPFAGMEIIVTRKLRLVFKTDYLFNISNRQKNFTTGVRFYVGVLFYTQPQAKEKNK